MASNDEINRAFENAREKWETPRWRLPRDIQASGHYWAYDGRDTKYRSVVYLFGLDDGSYLAHLADGTKADSTRYAFYFGPIKAPEPSEAPKAFDVASHRTPPSGPRGIIPPTPRNRPDDDS